MNAAVDAVVCLLLVSASVVGVVTVDQSPTATAGDADAVADTLATTTAQVNYSLEPGLRELPESGAVPRDGDLAESTSGLARTTHGSLAGLLARVATTTSGVAAGPATDDPSDTPITRTREDFRRSVRDAVRARTGARVRIDATWRPYPDAPVGGAVGVGPTPPAGGVHTATLVVPTGVEQVPASATGDFETLGEAVAARTVQVLVPAGPARVTLRGGGPTAALLRYRYAQLATATNTSLSDALATEDTDAANERLTDALGRRMAADLRARYERPQAAADAVSVSSVRIVVRTWTTSEAA